MKNKLKVVKEGITSFFIPDESKTSRKGPGKKIAGFYNPSMEMNRDISILMMQWLVDNTITSNKIKVLDGLAASGARGVRAANEIDKEDIDITINDWDKNAFLLINKNIEYNKLKNAEARNENVNCIFCKERFHYIDIDPFGTPVPFIDGAVRSIYNGGVLAITATDTAALCGIYERTCIRRYNAIPIRFWAMHEMGLRILIGHVCRIAARHNRGLKVLVSHSTDHYMRTYLQVFSGVKKSNNSLKFVKEIETKTLGINEDKKRIGPLWIGDLHDINTVEYMINILNKKTLGTRREILRLLEKIKEEIKMPPFFYTLDYISSQLKISPPKLINIIEKLKSKGYRASLTHFGPTAFKTDAPREAVYDTFTELSSS